MNLFAKIDSDGTVSSVCHQCPVWGKEMFAHVYLHWRSPKIPAMSEGGESGF